jgi:hypothetical protein
MRIVKVLKWGQFITKLAAIGTAISGAVTALSGSAASGIAISAAGATTYAATNGIQMQGYEKTRHIPPGRVDKAANMMRMMEIDAMSKKKKRPQRQRVDNMMPVMPSKNHQAARSAAAQMAGGPPKLSGLAAHYAAATVMTRKK